MKDKKISHLWSLSILLLIFLVATSVNAAIYYVDQNHPQASNSNPGTESLPWKDAWYGAQQLYPGDTLFIKKGWYYNPNVNDVYNCGIKPTRNGTASNPIIIKAYPGHEVYLSGGPNSQTNPNSFTNIAIGTTNDVHAGSGSGYDYIIIDGFKIYGMVALVGTTGSVLKNCDIWGGGSGPHQFGSCVRIEWCYGCKVENNILRDNVRITTETQLNCPLLIVYDSFDCVIEHNHFKNGLDVGLYIKDHPVNLVVRYNIVEGCNDGLAGANQDNGLNLYIYQNIFKNNHLRGLVLQEFINGVHIYNNVFYNNPTAHIANWKNTIRNIHIYNNIYSANAQSFYYINGGPSNVAETTYNCFHGNSNWRINEGVVATQLSGWQGYGGYNFDAQSIAADPLFVDPGSGNFHLTQSSPCRNVGKNGINMGCYITGDEVIGLGLFPDPNDPANDLNPPNPPKGLRVIGH